MVRISSVLVQVLTLGLVGASCNGDNCLRALSVSSSFSVSRSLSSTSGSSTSLSYSKTSTSKTKTTKTKTTKTTKTKTSKTKTPKSTKTKTSKTTTSKPTSSPTSVAPTSTPTGFPSGPKACSGDLQISCHNTTVVEDLCCFNAPGGQLLATQFWDTAPSTGPNNSWTVHGLWPDHCDGTYDAECDPNRVYTNITEILQSYNKTDLLAYMSTYWKDYNGNDESFWEHEWSKHGTCISTLEPSCYNDYTGQQEVVDFFDKSVELFKSLDSYSFLEAAGIIPSINVTYTTAQIQSALTTAHGFPVTISCRSGALDEIWYHFNVLGSVATGTFIPTSPDGSKSNCPDTGIRYLPKYQVVPTPTTTGTAPTATVTQTPYLGRGYLQAYPETTGAKTGCLISAGTWYTTGTCATYTAVVSGEGFTLTSSKGPCDVVAGAFLCAAGNTVGIFTNLAGSLAYSGSSSFYAAAVPTGSVQQKVLIAPAAVEVGFVWQSI